MIISSLLVEQSHVQMHSRRCMGSGRAPVLVIAKLTSTAKSAPCCQPDPSRMLTVHCPSDSGVTAVDAAAPAGELS